MRAIVQRVTNAKVVVNQEIVGQIQHGLMVLLGIEASDNETDITWLAAKLTSLRIFDDASGIPNLSVNDINGELLVVSQFTLHASTKKGNRPSYIKAAKPYLAKPLYDQFCNVLQSHVKKQIQTGVFGAMMQVTLCNDGPVTIIFDTKNKE
jgi:D-tyrosyl-tRNA(Tyr) deacylase